MSELTSCCSMHELRRAARLAQSVEHQTFNLRVKGSSPLSGYAHFFSNRIFVCLLWFGGRLINIAPSYWSVLVYNIYFEIDNPPGWFYGVMVSTQDSESCDPSSNLGRTWTTLLFQAQTSETFSCPHQYVLWANRGFEEQLTDAMIAQLGER